MTTQPKPGLRERKKERTRKLIRHHTLRLVGERGYAATTVDQIAAACEISPSTFFRYFRNKDEAITQDVMDAEVFNRLRLEPMSPDEGLTTMLKRVIGAVYQDLTDEEWAEERQRMQLIQSVPELRGASLEEMSRPLRLAFEFIAERAGLPAEHPLVRAYGGAIVGGLSAIAVQPGETGDAFTYPESRHELIAQFTAICDLVAQVVVMPPELRDMIDARR